MPTPTTPAHAPPHGERVAIHCDATSFDAARAEPLRIAAVRLRGNRILTGSALILRAGEDGFPADAGARLAAFLGDRPLIGYFLDFSATLVERLIGAPLSNERIEVSGLYYDRKIKTALKHAVDLRLDRMIADLDLPVRADDARGTALAAAMAWLRLTGRG
ncbi:DNA polymerase III [Azospirillum griseum]|uniref:DNA polymerase III n=1 Tax=Azospirillum griseum TaxID=2496639 RepID=A0A431VI09_9PROT|nr:DNA polymerase III [Azospirillum griseum]RTR19867.1 DNA polymerase III [Azospirillum griseum]